MTSLKELMTPQAELLHKAKSKAGSKATWSTIAEALGINARNIKSYLAAKESSSYRSMPEELIEKIQELYDLNAGFAGEAQLYLPKGKVIVISSQKGGIGKTTLSKEIACALAAEGYRVCVCDGDPQGDLTSSFFPEGEVYPAEIEEDVDGPEFKPGQANMWNLFTPDSVIRPYPIGKNLSLIGAGLDLAEIQSGTVADAVEIFHSRLQELRDQHDVVIIDSLPSFGNIQAALQRSADWLVISAELARFARKGVSLQMRTANNSVNHYGSNIRLLGIVENKVKLVNRKDNKLKNIQQAYHDAIKEEFGDLIVEPQILLNDKFSEAQALGQSIFQYAPTSEPALQIKELAFELMQRIQHIEENE